MIWFNIKALEKLLVEGKVSEKLAFNYLLTHLIFLTLTSYITGNSNPLLSILAHLIISLIAVIWGVRKTFEINQGGDNRDYFKRIISLTFVVGIRTVVFAFIGLFVLNLFNEILDVAGVPLGLTSLQEELLELAGLLLFTIFYYYMLLKSFKRINSATGAEKQIEIA